ncbi:hypothetical protein LVB87_08820 [Lysobacter sp. KIS68-7]|uniref:hypothetical protein n=1 Tax=Lysobacter sp. KIS68-7 TaxID=2904252 RepID=UPI001E3B30B3|nr:hypothetical protein [Lysobacter sp. KIS68-7]UHQ18328.1 hypothetical protein LVB87_08820 [Lysobacter sp. KIS68-7]
MGLIPRWTRNAWHLSLLLVLTGCVRVGERESWKGVAWHYVNPAAGVSRVQAISEMEAQIVALGFKSDSPIPIDPAHKIFDRAYEDQASTVLVALDNRSDPNCFSVTVMIRQSSEDFVRARDFEDKYAAAIHGMPGWRVGEGACMIVDDNGRAVQSPEEARRISREPG